MKGIVIALLFTAICTCYASTSEHATELEALKNELEEFKSLYGAKLTDMEAKIKKQEYEIDMLVQSSTDQKREVLQLHGRCDVKYFDRCFFAVPVGVHRVNLEGAKLVCSENGARLADVYSEYHYSQLMDYLRPYISSRTDGGSAVEFRTGMTYNPKTGVMYLSDGSPAPYVHFRSSPWPKTGATYTGTGLVTFPVGDVKNGMYNTAPEETWFGALCEIDIN